ncbi:core histone macro-H2A.1 [Trichonephila clavipes]|nr:core histone macro-H2A.1 [Trichonephila clavipes]
MCEWDYTNERVLFWMDLNGDFKWVCSTITSQNIYGRAFTIILLTMRPSRLFVKIRCHAVLSIRKRSAGYVKSLVYADKPQTLDHLEDSIRRVIADIRPQMLEKVIENWTSRLDYIRASRGSYMPEIIFKMIPGQHHGPKLQEPPLRFLKRPAQLIRAHGCIIRQTSSPLVSS